MALLHERLGNAARVIVKIAETDDETLPDHPEVGLTYLAEALGTCDPDLAFLWRPAARDQNVDIMLEAAVNGQADAIVTFNIRDFGWAAARFDVEVLSPGAAWRRVEKRK